MFDSKFAEFCPGMITVAGWPWHGLAWAPYGQLASITLPNGSTIHPAGQTRDVTSSFYQPAGTVLRFKDPRAPDVVRTPEQLADDEEKGIEWRNEVLVNPRSGILYGKATTTQLSWIYHDGERNWLATAGQTSVRLAELLIGNVAREPVIKTIPITVVTDGVSFVANEIVDATIDGAKVIINISHDNLKTPGQTYEGYELGGRATWAHRPIRWAELVIEGDAATVRHLAGDQDALETYSTDEGLYSTYHWIGQTVGHFYDPDGQVKRFFFDYTHQYKRTLSLSDSEHRNVTSVWLRREGDNEPVSSASVRDDLGRYYTITIDGEVVEQGDRGHGTVNLIVHNVYPPIPVAAGGGAGGATYRMVVNVVRYGGTMLALSLDREGPFREASPQYPAIKQFVTKPITPLGVDAAEPVNPDGTQAIETIIRTPPYAGIYGSVNPITGVTLINAPHPSFWI